MVTCAVGKSAHVIIKLHALMKGARLMMERPLAVVVSWNRFPI
jgi:hypothetical protein